MNKKPQPPRVVLVETSHPGNIGATARAMKTMGLTQLYLVNPQFFPDKKADELAVNAQDVLQNAKVFSSLATALADCVMVVGASTRWRTSQKKSRNVKDSIRHLCQHQDATAIVFGRESSGLSNEELDLCDEQLIIPANPDYSSLNLSQAVQIVGYEWFIATENDKITTHQRELATSGQLQGFLTHLQKVIEITGFLDATNPRYMMRHLGNIFSRSHLDEREINILRGILSSIDGKLK